MKTIFNIVTSLLILFSIVLISLYISSINNFPIILFFILGIGVVLIYILNKYLQGETYNKSKMRNSSPILNSVIASLLVILGFSGFQRYMFMDVLSLLWFVPIISCIASLLCYIISTNLNDKTVTLWISIKCMAISFIFSIIIVYYKQDIIDIIISYGLRDYLIDIINIIFAMVGSISFILTEIWNSIIIKEIYAQEPDPDSTEPRGRSNSLHDSSRNTTREGSRTSANRSNLSRSNSSEDTPMLNTFYDQLGVTPLEQTPNPDSVNNSPEPIYYNNSDRLFSPVNNLSDNSGAGASANNRTRDTSANNSTTDTSANNPTTDTSANNPATETSVNESTSSSSFRTRTPAMRAKDQEILISRNCNWRITAEPYQGLNKKDLIRTSPILSELFRDRYKSAESMQAGELNAIHFSGFGRGYLLKRDIEVINFQLKQSNISSLKLRFIYEHIDELLLDFDKVIKGQEDFIELLKGLKKDGYILNDNNIKNSFLSMDKKEFFNTYLEKWDQYCTYKALSSKFAEDLINVNIKILELKGKISEKNKLLSRLDQFIVLNITNPNMDSISITKSHSILGETKYNLSIKEMKNFLDKVNVSYNNLNNTEVAIKFKELVSKDINLLNNKLNVALEQQKTLENQEYYVPYKNYDISGSVISDSEFDEEATSKLNKRLQKFSNRYKIKGTIEKNFIESLPRNLKSRQNFDNHIKEAISTKDVIKKKACLNLFVELGICTKEESEK